jgi:delta8-fatty-acid desaturase
MAAIFFVGCVSTVVARTANKDHDASTPKYGAYLSAGTALLAAQWLFAHPPEDESACLPVNKDKAMTYREDRGKTVLAPLLPEKLTSKGAKKNKPLKKYTMKEVAEKNTREELWVSIDGRVYDVTKFVDRHPGGPLVIEDLAGKDCTDAFMNYHQARIYKTMLPAYLIGEVTDVPVYPHVEAFRALRQDLLRRGLYKTEWKFYAKLGLMLATLLVGALYLSLACSSTTSHMCGAVLLGMFWQQFAGIGHDLGHSTVSRNFYTDHWLGSSLGCGLMGISTGWWKRSHNTHHVVCNSVEHDPDIQLMPVVSVSKQLLEAPYWSSYHSRLFEMDAISRFFISYQHLVFFPLMAVARFNLYAQSWIMLCSPQYYMYSHRKLEVFALLFFASWVLGVALTMNSWTESVAWVLLSHGVAGILHIQIIISHWSMETYHGTGYNDESDEWYRQQLKTTLDVDCPAWMDLFHIGLQFQVEHHLYPHIPRHNLRIVKGLVKEICKKYDIEYNSMGFFDAVKKNQVNLRETAMEARKGNLSEEDVKANSLMSMLSASATA